MNVQTILNATALLTGMIGSYIMFYYSPKVDSGTWLYSRSEAGEKKKRDKYKNSMMRNGMLLLFAGFLFQFISLFI